MFSLWGKIKLDGAEAKRDAQRIGSQVAREFGQQFRSTLRRFVGIGAILGGVSHGMNEAEEIQRGAARMGLSTEAYQRLRQASDDFGTSPEELARMAPSMGPEFQNYIRGLRQNRPILDPEAIRALLALRQAEQRALNRIRLPPGMFGQPSEVEKQLREANQELRQLREDLRRQAQELQETLSP